MYRNSARTAVAAVFMLAGPGLSLAQETAAPPAKPSFPAIVVTEVTTRPLVDRIIATGSVRAVEEVYVQPQVEGLSIKTLNADVGDTVTADSILAVLSDDSLVLEKSQLVATKAKSAASLEQIRTQVLEAKSNAEDAVRQRDRSANLAKTGTVSTSSLETATANSVGANARLRAAEQAVGVAEADLTVMDSQIADIDLRLARTGVKTPVSGTVAARSAKVGAIATGSATQPLFTIIRDGALELVADVSENDILRIKVGQKTRINLAGGVGTLTGSIRLVSPVVDPVTRLGSVHIAIDQDDKARSGMFGNAEVIIEETSGITLPLTAVTSGKGGSTARKVENDVVKQIKIETGIQDGSFIQILSGLASGDKVVAKAGAFVRDGDRITPVANAAAVSN